MANGYIPAQVERGGTCDPVKMETRAFLGGVLGIDINGERQPIAEGGIVDLSFVMDETEAAAEQATASAAAAAESAQTASEAAASARSSESAAQTAANAAEAAKDDAEDAASSANASKNTADSYATAAQTAAAQAQIADGNAERSAESAIAAAAQAASSAGNALSSANEAYTSASTAQAAADAAQTAQAAAEASEATASTAATTATQAKEAAQTAQTAAEAEQAAAAQSATAASGSATAAAGSASQAAASATAASGSATAAAQSAAAAQAAAMDVIDKAPVILDTASGAIASFPDGSAAPIKQLTVAVNPVQDLHGYDNPWPAGGNVNQWDEETELGTLNTTSGGNIASNNQIRTKNFIPVVAGQTYRVVTRSGYSNGIWTLFYDSGKTVITAGLPSGGQSANNARRFDDGATVTMPENCAFIRFYFQSGYGTTYNHDTAINYPSTVTTYAPCSNICPITGWTGAGVTRTGKNLLDYSTQTDGYRLDGNGDLVASGNHAVSDYIRVAPEESYYFRNMIGSTSGYALAEYDAYKRLVRSQTFYGSGSQSKAVTMQASTKYIRVCYGKTHTDDPAVLSPVENTDFAPYIGTTYPITFPSEAGTVYGGTLTVEEDGTGTLSVDRLYVDLGALTWLKSRSFYYANVPDALSVGSASAVNSILKSDAYQTVSYNDVYNATKIGIAMYTQQHRLCVYDPAIIDNTSLLSGRHAVYPITDPVVYTLTAEQTAEITTLLGQNNVWANTGDIAGIQYRCDTKLYIDKKLAALVAALS